MQTSAHRQRDTLLVCFPISLLYLSNVNSTYVDSHLKPFRCKQCARKWYSHPSNLSYHKKCIHKGSLTHGENSTLDLNVDNNQELEMSDVQGHSRQDPAEVSTGNKDRPVERGRQSDARKVSEPDTFEVIRMTDKRVQKIQYQFESRDAGSRHDDYQTKARVTSETCPIISLSAQGSVAEIRADTLHDPLLHILGRARASLDHLEATEISALEQMELFQLPPESLCDDLVHTYFKWVAPAIPVINRTQFMEQYHNKENPPSLLLIQAVLLAGSKAHDGLGLFESDGLPSLIIRETYRRAKALFHAKVEYDPVTTVQALTVMGWYCSGLQDTTEDTEHWTKMAIMMAQENGTLHAVGKEGLSRAEQRLRKRIWWTLFTLDRSIAQNRGRPPLINTAHCDIEPIGAEDFIESSDRIPINQLHVLFFQQYSKLHSIIDKILSQRYSYAWLKQHDGCTTFSSCDTALNDWRQNRPSELYWDPASHNFWSALLEISYYATLCLLHTTKLNVGHTKRQPPSGTPLNAISEIAPIVAALYARKELQKCPVSFVNDLLRSLFTYVIDSRTHGVHQKERAMICMCALKDISRVWAIPKTQYTLLESAIQRDAPEDISNAEHGGFSQQTYGDHRYCIKDSEPAVYNDGVPHSVPAILESPGQHTENWANIETCRLLQPGQDPNIHILRGTVLQPIQNPPQTPQIIQEASSPWSGFDINGYDPSQLGMFEAPQGGNGTDAWGDFTNAHYSAAFAPNQLVPCSKSNIIY